jgi:hypothetical protein
VRKHPLLLVYLCAIPNNWNKSCAWREQLTPCCRRSDRLTSSRQFTPPRACHQSHLARGPPVYHQVSHLQPVGRNRRECILTPFLCTLARRRLGEAHAGGPLPWRGGHRHQAEADDTMSAPPPSQSLAHDMNARIYTAVHPPDACSPPLSRGRELPKTSSSKISTTQSCVNKTRRVRTHSPPRPHRF